MEIIIRNCICNCTECTVHTICWGGALEVKPFVSVRLVASGIPSTSEKHERKRKKQHRLVFSLTFCMYAIVIVIAYSFSLPPRLLIFDSTDFNMHSSNSNGHANGTK